METLRQRLTESEDSPDDEATQFEGMSQGTLSLSFDDPDEGIGDAAFIRLLCEKGIQKENGKALDASTVLRWRKNRSTPKTYPHLWNNWEIKGDKWYRK